jgi:hypothetical protein
MRVFSTAAPYGNSSQEIIEGFVIEEKSPSKNIFSSSKQNNLPPPPTFGISQDNEESMVDSGFKINNQTFAITDNFHTPFAKQPINIGEFNLFEATVYAEKNLKVQEFLFGIPEVGKANLAEVGVEVWYDRNGEISEVKVIQKTNVIDKDTIIATHEKIKCQKSDIEEKCDNTKVSMKFLEPLKDSVMAIKAIDYKNRYQITHLNEGVDILGDSINPPHTVMIPSLVKGEGLIQVTQTSKYSPFWTAEDGRMFEKNNFDSFKEVNKKFERFQDKGNAFTRLHSSFGGIIAYEENRATKVYDSSDFISEISDSYAYEFSVDERITDEMVEAMLEQEQIAIKYLEDSQVQARFN